MRWGFGKGLEYFDAYLQLITASFSVYLLPTLSRLTEKRDITREVVKSLKFVLPAVAAASFTVWLLRDFAIWLLLSNKFTAMRDLFAWQLVGDVLKVGAYVFGYLVIAKPHCGFIFWRSQPVHFIDGICPLANPCAWCTGRGAGLYGNLYRLFFSLLWRL